LRPEGWQSRNPAPTADNTAKMISVRRACLFFMLFFKKFERIWGRSPQEINGGFMDKKNVDYGLYFVTDRNIMSCERIEDAVCSAIEGGATVVQLREKNRSSREFFETALKIKEICKNYNVPLIINDRADIAKSADCDGVHIGQSDLPVYAVRKIIGEDKIIGVSAQNVRKALEAQKDGADYLGVGALFSTSTKTNTVSVTPKELAEIKKSVSIPVVAIGGINKENIDALFGTGIDGVAVVSAIIAEKNIKEAAAEMKKKVISVLEKRRII